MLRRGTSVPQPLHSCQRQEFFPVAAKPQRGGDGTTRVQRVLHPNAAGIFLHHRAHARFFTASVSELPKPHSCLIRLLLAGAHGEERPAGRGEESAAPDGENKAAPWVKNSAL